MTDELFLAQEDSLRRRRLESGLLSVPDLGEEDYFVCLTGLDRLSQMGKIKASVFVERD